MKNFILIAVGIILIGAAVIVYYVAGLESTTIKVNGVRTNSESARNMVRYIAGGILGGLGLLFLVLGQISRSRNAKHQKQIQHILQTGVEAKGTVTFVDKNYAVLVNKKPIYSIVEYTYKDRIGQQHTRRVENLNSDMVIRKQIVVGSGIPIKYANEDSSLSVIVL